MTSRREFLAGGAAGLLPAAPRRRPNLLYIFSDEHRAGSLEGERFNQAHTPNLARFATQGVTFRNCISNYPVCSPYRAMLLTGRWPYQTGIVDNALQLRPEEVSLGRTFATAGYHTGYIGKWHLSPHDEDGVFIPAGAARQGFAHWQVWAKTNQHFDTSFTFNPDNGAQIKPAGYNCTLMTDEAAAFIAANRARPWMLMVSWNPPHPNFDDAPPEEKQRYDPAALEFRPNVRPTPQVRRNCQGYYGHISAVDREFGRLLRTLDETGQAQDTIVVYTSDHGDMMGSHGFGGKRLPWEESCRVPFMVRYPGATPVARTVDGLLSTIDIYPSMCGLAGIAPPGHCVGRDLSAAMLGRAAAFPESSFLMHIAKENATGGDKNPAPLFRGLRTATHTYAVAADGRWLLYDNREDPYQMNNRIDDPGSRKRIADFDGVMLDWLRRAQDPFPYDAVRQRRSKEREM